MEPLVRALVIITRDHVPKTDLLTSAILPVIPLSLVLIARAIQVHRIASVHLAEEGLALIPRVAAAFVSLVVAGTRALLGFLRGGRVEVADALVWHGPTGGLLVVFCAVAVVVDCGRGPALPLREEDALAPLLGVPGPRDD